MNVFRIRSELSGYDQNNRITNVDKYLSCPSWFCFVHGHIVDNMFLYFFDETYVHYMNDIHWTDMCHHNVCGYHNVSADLFSRLRHMSWLEFRI